MNNSFDRLIDGMCATLRREVLTRLDDEFARGQVFGVINVLNTFKVRADWSAAYLLGQLEAQRVALAEAAAIARAAAAADAPAEPAALVPPPAAAPTIDGLLTARDDANRAIAAWLAWLDGPGQRLPPASADAIERALRTAMRSEVDIELKNAPRPLFAEMSSGRET